MTLKYVSLPLFEDAFYNYSISLEGISYILEFLYNDRMQGYILNLYDAENNPIVLGERLVPNYPIFKDYAINGMTGWFWLEEKANLTSEPYKTYPDKLYQYYNFYYIFDE